MEADHSAPYARLAVRFAEALVASDFDGAHECLSPTLGRETCPEELRSSYEEMVAYGGGPATAASLVTTMEEWPDRKANDLGWAYVAITGEDFSEAVTVVVEQHAGGPLIRDIEWGRP